MKNINDLTEDCLILLFGQFLLQELIELRKVCQLWTVIIEQICRRKKSLKFFGSVRDIASYCEHLVNYGLHLDTKLLLGDIGKDDELVGYRWSEVSHMFTNVEHFVYYYSNWHGLHEMLKSMPNISSLFLVGDCENDEFYSAHRPKECNKFLKSLNLLASLKHLHLSGIFPQRNHNFPKIKILSKLESFTLVIQQENVLNLMYQVGEPLRKLSLNASVEFEKFEKLFKAKLNIFNRLTYLSIGSNYETIDNRKLFHSICETFKDLEIFEFGNISTCKQNEAIFSLAKLKNLNNLSVERMWAIEKNLLADKLEQIKNLQLTFHENEVTFPHLAIKSIFPNLESIKVLAHDENFINSAKHYLVDEHGLTCKVHCDLVITDSLIYMGRHRKEYEIEEEVRRILEEQARQEWLDKYGDDYYDQYERQSSSSESYIDTTNYYGYNFNDYGGYDDSDVEG